jgi:serine/threonine protein kinase
MKLMQYSSQKIKEQIINEIGLMQLNKGDSILGCEDIFDYKGRYWVIIDLMEGCLTDVIMAAETKYSENVCKYILYKTLKGL